MKSLPNSFFKDFNTERMVLVGSAKRLKKFYNENVFDDVYSEQFKEVYFKQRMVWFELYNPFYNLYLFDNQQDTIKFSEAGKCAYIQNGLFFEANDTAVVFNQKQFMHIMLHCKGDVSKYKNEGDLPIIWQQNMLRGFYELTYVEAHEGLGICLQRVTDGEKLQTFHFAGTDFLMKKEVKTTKKMALKPHSRTSELPNLMHKWKCFVDEYSATEEYIYEWQNDLDTRHIIAEILPTMPNSERKKVEQELKLLDAKVLENTFEINECVWGENVEKERNYNPKKQWYYYRMNQKVQNTEGGFTKKNTQVKVTFEDFKNAFDHYKNVVTKISEEQFKVFWVNDYYDGMLIGILEYKNQKCRFEIISDYYSDEAVKPRIFAVISLNKKQEKEVIYWHNLFQKHVGNHNNWNRTEPLRQEPESQHALFYDEYKAKYKMNFAKNEVIAWYEIN